MAQESKKMKPIWYFVGLMLVIMGGIILITGLYYLFFPVQTNTVLAELHPDIWWGGGMLIVGIVFLILNKKASVE